MRSYDPRDWYWIVAGSKTDVYASARRAYVPVADAQFQAFRAGGGVPTKIASEDELRDVLAGFGLGLSNEKPAIGFDDDPIRRVLFEIALSHENRIRAVQGQAAITHAQFLSAIRNLL